MGILQARILEWAAMLSSRGSSWPRNRTRVSCSAGGFFTTSVTWEAPRRGIQMDHFKSLVWRECGSRTVVDLDTLVENHSQRPSLIQYIRIWVPDPGEVWHSAEFAKDYQKGSGKSPEANWVHIATVSPFLWVFDTLPQTKKVEWTDLSPDSLEPYGDISFPLSFSLCLAEKGIPWNVFNPEFFILFSLDHTQWLKY